MSRSPTSQVDPVAAIDYVTALGKWSRLVRSGLSHSGREPHCVFLNTGGARFADVSSLSGLEFIDDGRGLAWVDWDEDGDLDVWVSNRTGPQVRFLRNDLDSGHGWVALRLVGTEANRDAIGARVELELDGGAGPPRIRTLHGGDGFLSQSSRTLLFGLGRSERIARVVVRWPGGEPEVFEGIDADRRYRLVQGAGRAREWPRPKRPLRLAPGELDAPPLSLEGRVWLASRAPVPSLPFTDFDGGERRVDLGAGPLLVNLWASWCAPCAEELGEIARRAEELRESGLEVVALSVDGLGDGRSVAPDALRRFLAALQFEFPAGATKAETVDKLELLYAQIFGRHITFPIPVSFLVDGSGELAALYFGRIEVSTLLDDRRRLEMRAADPRTAAQRFGGRWHTPPREFDRALLADEYLRSGYVEDALPLFEALVARDPHDTKSLHHLGASHALLGHMEQAERYFRAALRQNPDFVASRYGLALIAERQGRGDEAIAALRAAVAISPDYHDARERLGVLLAKRGDLDGAIENLDRALQTEPHSAATRYTLGLALLQRGRTEEAARHLGRAVELAPDNANAREALGRAWTALGRTEEAEEQYRAALRIEPTRTHSASALAWLLATGPEGRAVDVEEAVRFAEQAAEAADGHSSRVLDVLATAYAAAGRFDDALATLRRARALAERAGEWEQVGTIDMQRAAFEAGRPWRETVPASDEP